MLEGPGVWDPGGHGGRGRGRAPIDEMWATLKEVWVTLEKDFGTLEDGGRF